MSRFHDHEICQLYSMAPKNKVRIFLYYSYILAKVVDLGGVILLALCAEVIVHPNIIHGNTIIEIIGIIHIFHTITIHRL